MWQCPLLAWPFGIRGLMCLVLSASDCLCRGLWQNEDSCTVSQLLFPTLHLRSHPDASSSQLLAFQWDGGGDLFSGLHPWSLYKKYLCHKHQHLTILACWASGKMNLAQQHLSLTVKLFSQALTSCATARNLKITEIKPLFEKFFLSSREDK